MFILALQTDSGRLYWGGMRELRNDQGYRWQENPHQACCFRDAVDAEHYRNENGLGHICLIVDFEVERVGWRNSYKRRDVLRELIGHTDWVLYAIAEILPADIVNRIEATYKESR